MLVSEPSDRFERICSGAAEARYEHRYKIPSKLNITPRIAFSEIIAIHLQTVAAANSYRRSSPHLSRFLSRRVAGTPTLWALTSLKRAE
jgi:hypothetical protein